MLYHLQVLFKGQRRQDRTDHAQSHIDHTHPDVFSSIDYDEPLPFATSSPTLLELTPTLLELMPTLLEPTPTLLEPTPSPCGPVRSVVGERGSVLGEGEWSRPPSELRASVLHFDRQQWEYHDHHHQGKLPLPPFWYHIYVHSIRDSGIIIHTSDILCTGILVSCMYIMHPTIMDSGIIIHLPSGILISYVQGFWYHTL